MSKIESTNHHCLVHTNQQWRSCQISFTAEASSSCGLLSETQKRVVQIQARMFCTDHSDLRLWCSI